MSNAAVIVRTIQQFYEVHRYDQLFPNDASISAPALQGGDWLYRWFAHPRVPFMAVIAYLLLSKKFFGFLRDFFKVKPKGPVLQWTTIIHSAILAVYSAWTCYHTAKIVLPLISQNGLYATLCDNSGDVWFKEGLGFWVAHFYLSKFYEFIDTWIITLKGREPIFLQTYHHAGIVIFMWGFTVTAATAGALIVTLFNSFIHTLMYTYYTLAAFGYSSPLKHYLTQAQIIQFIVGIAITVPTLFMDQCVNPAQSVVILGIQIYAVILIYLFYDFYQKSYTKKGSPSESPSSSKKSN